jgi:PAS domain S-box-containing protein
MTLALSREPYPQSGAALVAAASGASVAALGGLVVAGWLTVAVALIQVLPGLPPMHYNTALSFMICGAALLTAALELRRPTALLGGLATCLGLATLWQYVFQADLGIDDLLVETYVHTGVSHPGRMAPNTAVALTLVGLALVALSWRQFSLRWHIYPALLGSIVIALGTAALVGYAAGVPLAYSWGHFNHMAVHTALGFILLGGGVVGLAWNAAPVHPGGAPPWLPTLAGVAVGTVTLCMWYALAADPRIERHNAARPLDSRPDPALPNVTLAAGLLSALLLGWSLRVEQTSRRRARSLAASNVALRQQSDAREKAEETLHQLAAIVEHSNDAIFAATLDGTILTWNGGAEQLFGYSQEEMQGRQVSSLQGSSQADDLLRKVSLGERVEELEAVNVRKDGRSIDVALTISPMLDRKGQIIGASIIARDITERKQLEQMKDDFVGTVSHELRTPLTAIKGFIELVADGEAGPLSDAQREFLQIAARNTDRLGNLINDLLDVNRIEAQLLEIRFQPTDLGAVLNEVMATFKAMAESRELTFRAQIDPIPMISGDAPRLVQVFSNLVSNAIKYTPRGEVGMRARVYQDWAEVCVHDSGVGLSPEEQARLFTKFFRARNPLVAESGGTGLGLVIVKAIVEKHRGTVEVESHPGRGTRFRVRLPLNSPSSGPEA